MNESLSTGQIACRPRTGSARLLRQTGNPLTRSPQMASEMPHAQQLMGRIKPYRQTTTAACRTTQDAMV